MTKTKIQTDKFLTKANYVDVTKPDRDSLCNHGNSLIHSGALSLSLSRNARVKA